MLFQKIFTKILLIAVILAGFSCAREKDIAEYDFDLLTAEKTGIDFSNTLKPTKDFNIFYYMYFYNGGGVGAGDLNNDGLIDLCFTANQEPNRIYLNKSGMKFEDVTEKANFKGDKGWSNGVSIVDINQDGMLDIYISQVGDFESMKGHNLLFVCQEIKDGVPVYVEKSKEYGLDLVVFGTQAMFFDYDLDGDLDMFQLNHSVHQNGTFGRRALFENVYHPLAGDKLFRNDNGKYVEVSKTTGIHSSALGYGLGLGVGDINFDGYPDMYIGNDFHENDYLYINQKNGAFRDMTDSSLMHTSQFSMGVDIGDLNNDIFPEIVSLDMLPSNYEILKKSEGEDMYSIFKYKIRQGYNYQFARNNLQYNNGNGTFSEIGMYSGVHSTDWSWAALFSDFNNDGLKDLFISNGIPKRMNDTDYIKFVSDDVVQEKIRNKNFDENDPGLADKLPEIKLNNKFFANKGDLAFTDMDGLIRNDQVSYSNGSVYADLDNDGDLDIATNNINEKAFVYENLNDKKAGKGDFTKLYLKGKQGNRNAIGTKCLVFKKDKVLSFEKFPVRGFQSSMEVPLHLGLGKKTDVDSVFVIWPDNRFQVLKSADLKDSLTLTYKNDLPVFDYQTFKTSRETKDYTFEDIAAQLGVDVKHEENNFVEFDRNSLIPFEVTADGPALAIADINHDGLDDIFVGSSKKHRNHLFLQTNAGVFKESLQQALLKDSTYEEVSAEWVDVNRDGHVDLVVATGGNEYVNNSEFQMPRIYLNDGKGNLSARADAFANIYVTASCVIPFDFTGDGVVDLFIGGRAVPLNYGEIPKSYLLKNDGSGKFTDVTSQYGKELSNIGYVKNAKLADLDKDGDQDLVLALEWDGIVMMQNNGKSFSKKMLTDKKGWWNFVMPYDFDGDGDLDILAGNLGLNSRLKANAAQPVKMYINDYDGNGRKEPLLTYNLNGKEALFPTKLEMEKQMPVIRKKYIFATDFARANIGDIVGEDKLKEAQVLSADYFENAVLVNDGKGNFEVKPLGYKAQWTPFYDAQIIDANGDKLPDVLIMGNFYNCNIQMGRYDSDFGTVLINRGNCNFTPESLKGLQVKGQVKHLKNIKLKSGNAIVAARNDDKLVVIRRKK
ncbi:VCBS repeat-containing protein [Dyadobacter chenhuakuii]|uniref:VCBS repeat-containing protein n=1 Tax=Dyadobacter chenhuakuii TaxID=2909339 RepID=A0ABY4XKL5_9BACT|nr:VCBS repeat-containing protein [Dyadobacter chenhuakuii]MCF2496470.1 VCBS repeat-containing protein [Dyadobacter chenhuakuii]USJ30527.1 VCBS repeat-containing protein [Dyadobacter chenhuakuii]